MERLRFWIALSILFVTLIVTPSWASTYYIRADGTAANKAAATGPETDPAACMTITTHNGETFSPGDIIIVSGLGGVLRTTAWKVPSDGTSGSLIEYRGSNNAIISGGTFITGFTQYSGNIYYKSVTAPPGRCWYNETIELISASGPPEDLDLY